uniref:actin cytoskeleton-regulatory complex protein pan1-like isoform X2 n=1 Tax=Erigeron canadensis TaxID=72917 RepID=UPI001CB91AB2|nr:actin cytoskeleton-regulatory complex protein pan1-like isoform X2 [Erigeron canadensis]
MPRSSRSKSHKQSKHSSSSATAAREYSGSDEDVKVKEKSSINGGKEDSVRVSVSSEKRKHIKDLIVNHLNGDVNEEYANTNTSLSKRREEKVREGSDRWNGGSSDEKGLNMDVLGKSKDLSKSGSDSKSKSSKRNDGESASGVLEKDRGEKRKSERKESSSSSQYVKESKESKDKDRGRKSHSDKVENEAVSKQGENQSSKRVKEITEWPIEEDLRNPELEKELEKRMRRRGESSSDKDKYQDDVKEAEDRRLSSRTERAKDERHKNEEYVDVVREDSVKETRQRDEKHREDGERDRKNRDVKHRGESERYNKHRDDKYRDDKYSEDGNKDNKYKDEKYIEIAEKDEKIRDGKRKQDDDRDYRHKDDKYRDARHRDDADREKRVRDSKYASRDHPVEPETKRLRDDGIVGDLYNKKTNNRDGSPIYDDRVARYKDDKDRRRGNDKDESNDYRSRSMKEQRSDVEKRSSAKAESLSERGRPGSRYADAEVTTSHSRRRSSPGGSSYPARDQHRVSKQEESKYRDYAYEDRTRHNAHSSRDYTSVPGQSDKKVTPKDDSYMKPDSRSSPQVDKSPSSTSNERRNLNRSDARRSLDLEEPGPRSGGSKDAVKDGKGSRDLSMEAHPDNDFSQVDNENLSASSPYTRNNHFSEDDRNKSNNRHRRMADQNMGRSQGNWKNVPNWPSPMPPGGYIPFQHVPPPMFHPLMQQFPPPMFGRPPMKLNPGLPYHVPEHGRPLAWRNQVDESVQPPLHGWDANNAVFSDESHLYGRLDWDRRNQLNNRGWEQSGDLWKSQNAGPSMDGQLGPQKDGYSTHGPTDESWSGQTSQPDDIEQNQLDIQAETLNLERIAPEAQKVTESPQVYDAVKEDNSTLISRAYLSRIDVSQDLTQPDLFEKCIGMMDVDQDSSDEFDCKILFVEESVESNITNGASLFTVTNDSVFQKAMFLYKKQKEELHLMYNEKSDPEFVPPSNKEIGGSDGDGKPLEEVAAEDIDEVSKDSDAPPVQNLDAEAIVSEQSKSEELMDMEVDHAIVKQEEEPELTMAPVEECLAPSVSDLLPSKVKEESEFTNDEKIGGGDVSLSDMSTTGVPVMSPIESIEFGSVNLNRIHHHSPESTH